MRPAIWTDAAKVDLAEIAAYIARDSPRAAEHLIQRFRTVVFPLSEHPCLYPESQRMPGHREIVAHPNYLVFYRVLADKISIEMVAHGRRNFPVRR